MMKEVVFVCGKHLPVNVLSILSENVKLFLWLTKYHTMKTCGMSGSIAPHILNLSTTWR